MSWLNPFRNPTTAAVTPNDDINRLWVTPGPNHKIGSDLWNETSYLPPNSLDSDSWRMLEGK